MTRREDDPRVWIRAFEPSMEAAARELIVGGLTQRVGIYDPTHNPDLEDLAASYQDAIFLVAEVAGMLVGTGIVQPEAPGEGRVVRMSVAPHVRRRGIGSLLLEALEWAALEAGYQRLVLETTSDWEDAQAFYTSAASTSPRSIASAPRPTSSATWAHAPGEPERSADSRALAVAAASGHELLLLGPPGPPHPRDLYR